MSLEDLRLRVADGIDDAGMIFFTEDQIDHSIDEAMEVIAEKSGCIKRSAFVSVREGANFYFINSIATDIMIPYRIWNENRGSRLKGTTMAELDSYHRTWLTTSGDPDSWFPVSWDYFGVYPHAATAGGVLRVDYLAWPRALQDDDDEPELPESSQDALIHYAINEGHLKQWDTNSALLAWAMFQKATGESKARTNVERIRAGGFTRGGLKT